MIKINNPSTGVKTPPPFPQWVSCGVIALVLFFLFVFSFSPVQIALSKFALPPCPENKKTPALDSNSTCQNFSQWIQSGW